MSTNIDDKSNDETGKCDSSLTFRQLQACEGFLAGTSYTRLAKHIRTMHLEYVKYNHDSLPTGYDHALDDLIDLFEFLDACVEQDKMFKE